MPKKITQAKAPNRPTATHVVPDRGEIQIKTESLRVPTRQYDADFGWVQKRLGALSFFFAKEGSRPDALATRVEVRFPFEPFRQLWANTQGFYQNLETQSPRWETILRAREPIAPEGRRVLKEHSVWANVAQFTASGDEATLDFFRLTPRTLLRLGSGALRTPEIDGVMTVSTTTAELLWLLRKCGQLVDTLGSG